MPRTFVAFAMSLILAAAASAEFRAGVAVRVVTPDPPLPIVGGIGAPRPVEEVRSDLTVRALVFEQGDNRVALVGSDFLGFPHVLCDRVREQVPGIPPENVIISATHTHSAPDVYGFSEMLGDGVSTDLEYLDFVVSEMAAAINEAVDTLQPASVRIAEGEPEGKIAYNYYAEQLFDPRAHVIQAVGANGEPMATLLNYAIHPEVLGPGNGILSPDLCGPLYDRIEARGGGVGIFIPAAIGGMITADNRGEDGRSMRTWDECVRIGELLADKTLRIIEDAPLQEEPSLWVGARDVYFPIDNPMIRAVLLNSPLEWEIPEDWILPAQVNVVNLGNAQMLTIPGEAMPNIGYYLRRNMHGEYNLLLGLANDAFGYIIAKVDWNSFPRYDYITRTSLGEMTGEIFMEESLAFVDEAPRPE